MHKQRPHSHTRPLLKIIGKIKTHLKEKENDLKEVLTNFQEVEEGRRQLDCEAHAAKEV